MSESKHREREAGLGREVEGGGVSHSSDRTAERQRNSPLKLLL